MEERKNIVYTAVDLQRYHSGTMSEAEMHALEKAALDDPFLSEALEGYVFTTTAEKDIIELKNRLSEKEKNKKEYVWQIREGITNAQHAALRKLG